jgi:ribosomal protein L11 methyltransferase
VSNAERSSTLRLPLPATKEWGEGRGAPQPSPPSFLRRRGRRNVAADPNNVKRQTLWRVSVTTTPHAEEATAEMLGDLFGTSATSYTDVETRRSTASVYLSSKPDWPKSRSALVAGMTRLKRCGLGTGAVRVSLRKLRPQDWAESWKRHFQPLAIGSSLLIKPSWSKRRPRKSQAVVVLDPGLSFGTGQHPTTSFCLRQLELRRPRNAGRSLLDIGTGSGILAIAAAKLGYSPIEAFDFDPEAVRIAGTNARRNGVGGKVRIYRSDLTRLPMKSRARYDVICANLISNMLISQSRRILSRLKPGGSLIVAGILKAEFRQIQTTYEKAGLELAAMVTESGWRSGAFVSALPAKGSRARS